MNFPFKIEEPPIKEKDNIFEQFINHNKYSKVLITIKLIRIQSRYGQTKCDLLQENIQRETDSEVEKNIH